MMNIIRSVDFSGIEARVIAWLAGEEWKLDMFRRYDDAKKGPHPYVATAAGLYSVPVSAVDDGQRLVGKVAELALGFGGGPGAFAKMAKTQRLDISSLQGTVEAAASVGNLELAYEDWVTRGTKTGMGQAKWITAELIKLAWRDNHPRIRQFWTDVESAAIEAIESPGKIVAAGEHVRYRRAGSWLLCRLPSGRCIAYAYPKVELKATPWGSKRPAVVYKGVGSPSRKWEEQDFYGGLGAENITQAVARDVMRDAMFRVEAAGYPLILTVHDELISETPLGFYSLQDFSAIAAQPVDWAPGLPIAVEGWEDRRYRKG